MTAVDRLRERLALRRLAAVSERTMMPPPPSAFARFGARSVPPGAAFLPVTHRQFGPTGARGREIVAALSANSRFPHGQSLPLVRNARYARALEGVTHKPHRTRRYGSQDILATVAGGEIGGWWRRLVHTPRHLRKKRLVWEGWAGYDESITTRSAGASTPKRLIHSAVVWARNRASMSACCSVQ